MRVRVGNDNKNRPKRCQMRRLAGRILQFAHDLLICVILLTNLNAASSDIFEEVWKDPSRQTWLFSMMYLACKCHTIWWCYRHDSDDTYKYHQIRHHALSHRASADSASHGKWSFWRRVICSNFNSIVDFVIHEYRRCIYSLSSVHPRPEFSASRESLFELLNRLNGTWSTRIP